MTIIGWYAHIHILITFIPDYIGMVFNAALCFVMAGLGLFVPVLKPERRNKIYFILGALIFIIAALTLSQYIFNYSLGLDHLFVKDWLLDQGPCPGRMAENTAVAFILTGLSYILLPYTKNRMVAMVVQISILAITLLGVLALLGHVLKLEYLYSWYQYSRMALHTSLGFTLLGVGLGAEWSQREEYLDLYKGRDDQKILILSAIILVSIASIASMAGFSASSKRNEAILKNFLQQAMQNRVDVFQAAITRPIHEMSIIHTNSVLQQEILNKANGTRDGKLEDITRQLVSDSFSAVQINDVTGHQLYSIGEFAGQPDYVFPIRSPYNAKLLWKNGILLQLSSDILKNGQRIGTIVAEWPLDSINELISNNDFFICNINSLKQLVCVPPSAGMKEFSIFSNGKSERQLEHAALSMKKKYILGSDYRKIYVMAIYQYFNTLGLGFVYKADTAEIYEPMRNQLMVVLPILLVVICFGILLLYWQVMPLVRKVIRSEEKLQESENRFRLSFDSAATGMALSSLDGKWLRVNPALCDILGYSESELLNSTIQSILHQDDIVECLACRREMINGDLGSFQLEKRFYRKDRQLIWVLLSVSLVRDAAGKGLYFIDQIQDITQKKKAEQELSYQAYYDALTGLVNRNHLEKSLEMAISAALRNQKNFAVFFLDIDHFKMINDTLGHDTGDELLKIIAERLKNSIRITDVAARLGGDEFILILNGINTSESAAIFADKIINIILQPIKIHQHELYISISIGISFFPNDGADYQSLIKSADLALYSAKEKGRNNYQFCTPKMYSEIKEKFSFKMALQEALDKNEFYLAYQPKMKMKNHDIVGAEAFLRWRNSKYGEVTTDTIISMAEESGFIIPLSEWIIQTACLQAKAWQTSDFPEYTVAINISNRQFKHIHFVNSVLSALKKSMLAPQYLQLEISEVLLMQDPEYSLKALCELKDIGVQITIDNFGTGFSSMVYLHKFPIDRIKIDRSLVQQVTVNPNQAALIEAIIELAKSLHIKVVVEGVETKEQYEFLMKQGCEEVQGYYICRPMEADQVKTFIQEFQPTLEDR
jgi:diguanylate cyclase (GGDEF)-like protein/PAS domain S-box-containing protein